MAQSGVRVLRDDTYAGEHRTYVVLGAPRGGTSMVAGTLRLLGITMGEALGHQHEDPRMRQETALTTKLEAIAEYNASFVRWGWKLPNTIYYFPDVFEALVNPVFVVVYRNPLAVAVSSANRDRRAFEMNLLNVPINHYKEMQALISAYTSIPVVCISYDEAIAPENRRPFITTLAQALGLECGPDLLERTYEFVDARSGYKRLD